MTALGLVPLGRLALSPRRLLTPAFAPLHLADLAFWYRAGASANVIDTGVIETLYDLSGHARHGTASGGARPADTTDAAGFAVARFDGTDDVVSVTNPPDASTGATVFVVGRMRTRVDFEGILSAGAAGNTDHEDFFTFENATAASGLFQVFGRSLETDTLLFQSVDEGDLFYGIFRVGGGAAAFRAHGLQDTDTYDGDFGQPDAIVLGARWVTGAPASFAPVDLLEVGWYSRVLADTELDQLEAYLAARYGIDPDALLADVSLVDGEALSDGLTYSRPSAGATRDHLGIWHQAKSGELRLEGLRRNAYGSTIPKDISSWNVNGKTGAGTAPVITNNFGTDPDGTPAKATRVVLTPGGTTSGDSSLLRHDGAFTDAIALSRRTSLWMKLNTGSSATIRITSQVQAANVVVTDTWQRFAAPADTGTTCRVIIQARGDITGAAAVDLLIANGDDYGVMLAEDSNGAPQEYVNPGRSYNAAVAGVRYHTTTNGNTVDGNGVVTEAAGSLISASTRKGALLEPQRTNVVARSYDLTGASWTGPIGGTGTEALDATGIDGVASRASTIADTDAANLVSWSIAPTLSGTTAHVLSVLVDKDADTSRFPELLITGYVTDIGVQLNTSTGASVTRTGSPDFVSVEDAGDWWWLKIGFTATSTSGSVLIYPAMTASLGSQDATATGSIVVGHVQLEAGVFATSPIRTAGTGVTRLADALSWDAGYGYAALTVGMDFRLLDGVQDLDGRALIGSDDAGGATAEPRVVGNGSYSWSAPVLTVPSGDYVGGVDHKLAVAVDVSDVKLWLDGAEELSDASALAAGFADAALDLLSYSGGSDTEVPATLARVTVHARMLDDTELEARTT